MKKLVFFALFSLGFLPAAFAGDFDGALADNEGRGDKLRVAFVQEIKGQKYVFLRLTPDQLVSGKARRKVKIGKGMIRVILRPRQIARLNSIMEEESLQKRFAKLVIRIPHRSIKKKGPRSVYVVRPLSVFAGSDESMDVDDPVEY